MRLFKRRTSADLEGDPQLTGLRFESGHNQGETKFLSQNSSLDDNISIATAPTPEPRLIMSHSPRSLKKISSGKSNNPILYGFYNPLLESGACFTIRAGSRVGRVQWVHYNPLKSSKRCNSRVLK